MQGRKSKREIQHEAISHSYAKYSHAMQIIRMLCKIFACYAKSSHAMRNLCMLCKIQKDVSFKTNLEHFPESIIYILYIIFKLRKLGVQRFKQCANRSWNEEVMATWRQLQQDENEFRNPFSALRKFCKPIYPLQNWRIS